MIKTFDGKKNDLHADRNSSEKLSKRERRKLDEMQDDFKRRTDNLISIHMRDLKSIEASFEIKKQELFDKIRESTLVDIEKQKNTLMHEIGKKSEDLENISILTQKMEGQIFLLKKTRFFAIGVSMLSVFIAIVIVFLSYFNVFKLL